MHVCTFYQLADIVMIFLNLLITIVLQEPMTMGKQPYLIVT
jgi:hypothetical protein